MYPQKVLKNLPELIELERNIQDFKGHARVEVLQTLQFQSQEFPLYKITLGPQEPTAPTLFFSGGVHGLERIGTQVILAIMKSVVELLSWDEVIHHTLSKVRLVFVPLVNPVGMYLKQRSNGNGVDLMRNGPIEAGDNASFLVGGHRISNRLPWFRGQLGKPIELETDALMKAVRAEMFQSRCCLSVDFHSGFGAMDRLWFPYAKTTTPFPHLPELHSLKMLLDRTYPNHFYKIEPQAKNYTTHGDLWDCLYDEYYSVPRGQDLYLPLTLEMGSWMWVKKNPRQFFSALGPFNPMLPHRRQRILRRHNTLFEFLLRSVLSPKSWAHLEPDDRLKHLARAKDFWYAKAK